MKKCFSLLVTVMVALLANGRLQAQAQAPERTFEEILGKFTREQLRALAQVRDTKEAAEKSQEMSTLLKASLEGQKCTLKFTMGDEALMKALDNRTAFHSDPTEDVVRVEGVRVHVRVRVEVEPGMVAKIAECRPGRKTFASGTISSANFFAGVTTLGSPKKRIQGPKMVLLDLTMVADGFGPEKK